MKYRRTPPFDNLPFCVPDGHCARDAECNGLKRPEIKYKEIKGK